MAMQDITPQGNGDRTGWILFGSAAIGFVFLVVGLFTGVLDPKTPIVEQLVALFH